jgi:hypothetical protein
MSTLRQMVKEMRRFEDAPEVIDEDEDFDEELDEGLNDLCDLVEEAGFEVPEDIEDVAAFLAAVEKDVLEAGDLDEKFGAAIKKAWGKAKGAVESFMQKRSQKHPA